MHAYLGEARAGGQQGGGQLVGVAGVAGGGAGVETPLARPVHVEPPLGTGDVDGGPVKRDHLRVFVCLSMRDCLVG